MLYPLDPMYESSLSYRTVDRVVFTNPMSEAVLHHTPHHPPCADDPGHLARAHENSTRSYLSLVTPPGILFHTSVFGKYCNFRTLNLMDSKIFKLSFSLEGQLFICTIHTVIWYFRDFVEIALLLYRIFNQIRLFFFRRFHTRDISV